jgi:hypothetical protein
VSQFVEECRREWKRLRVPDAIANEMAADLEADLDEAAAEGASPEDVLGSAVFDPRAFAASWAVERGVVELRPVHAERPARRPFVLAAIAASALVAVLGAVLTILASSGTAEVALAPPLAVHPRVFTWIPAPKPGSHTLPRLRGTTLVLPFRARPWQFGAVRAFGVRAHGPRRTAGVILLIAGSLGLIVSTLYGSPWGGPRRRRRTYAH